VFFCFVNVDKGGECLEDGRFCAFQANYHLIWATKYRRKVLKGPVEAWVGWGT